MGAWEIFWAVIVVFSTLSFAYMSIKILIKGTTELKEMFRDLK